MLRFNAFYVHHYNLVHYTFNIVTINKICAILKLSKNYILTLNIKWIMPDCALSKNYVKSVKNEFKHSKIT